MVYFGVDVLNCDRVHIAVLISTHCAWLFMGSTINKKFGFSEEKKPSICIVTDSNVINLHTRKTEKN